MNFRLTTVTSLLLLRFQLVAYMSASTRRLGRDRVFTTHDNVERTNIHGILQPEGLGFCLCFVSSLAYLSTRLCMLACLSYLPSCEQSLPPSVSWKLSEHSVPSPLRSTMQATACFKRPPASQLM